MWYFWTVIISVEILPRQMHINNRIIQLIQALRMWIVATSAGRLILLFHLGNWKKKSTHVFRFNFMAQRGSSSPPTTVIPPATTSDGIRCSYSKHIVKQVALKRGFRKQFHGSLIKRLYMMSCRWRKKQKITRPAQPTKWEGTNTSRLQP